MKKIALLRSLRINQSIPAYEHKETVASVFLQQSLITFEWFLLLDIVFFLNLEDCWKTGISFEVNCLYMVSPSELLDFQSFHSVVLTFPLSPVTWLAFIHGVRLGKSRLYLRLQFLLKLGGAQCLFWGLICQSFFGGNNLARTPYKSCMNLVNSDCFQ